LRWLSTPYRNAEGDRNLSGERFEELVSLFGGADAFTRTVKSAGESARVALMNRKSIRDAIEESVERTGAEMHTLRSQAESRISAGKLVNDTEGLVLDHRIASAIQHGISALRIRTLAVSCIVRANSAVGAIR